MEGGSREERDSWLRRLDRSGVPLLAARIGIALPFILFGLAKTTYPLDFLKVVKEYHLFPLEPPHFINLVAVSLPWLEVILGIALLAGIFVRAAGITIALMLPVFTVAIFLRAIGLDDYTSGKIAFHEIEFDCGCGAGTVVVYEKMIENSLFFLAALIAVFSRSRRFCLEAEGAPASAPPAGA
ncbi:MAG: DoxX family protein [Planctomycetes bacterium]|nr:DoxX family protein [Planctomycetota bacterium]